MTEKRIQINKIIENQLPSYVREEFPLISEFLKQYYIGQEYQGATLDLIQNIDNYTKLDTISDPVEFTILSEDIDDFSTSIVVENTVGFPNQYGLLKIDSEIITYTSKTDISFDGCVRGFSGITSYRSSTDPENLVFSESEVSSHTKETHVENLSILFFKEFLSKIKYQLSPGFEDRSFVDGIKDSLFLKQSKDFYSSKGTDKSFDILFKVLYGEKVKVIRPRENVIRPSNANYRVNKDLVVDSFEGDPSDLKNSTLYQDYYNDDILESYSPITRVEKISPGLSTNYYYKLSLDASFDRDIVSENEQYNNFSVHPKTKLIGNVSVGSTILDVDSTVGFPINGRLSFLDENGEIGIATYSSKNLTQFLGVNLNNNIKDTAELNLDVYAYANQVGTSISDSIKVRIRPVLKKFNIPEKTYYYSQNDQISIKTLGTLPTDKISNNWLFNTSQTYEIESIVSLDSSNLTYKVTTKDNHILRINDEITFISSSGESEKGFIIDVFSDRVFLTRGQGQLNENLTYAVKRNILKTKSSEYPTLSGYTSNVQNVYKNEEKNIISSLSLPYYNIDKLNSSKQDYRYTFSGTFSGDTFKITNGFDHNFYTGDAIYYTPEKSSFTLTDSSGQDYIQENIISFLFDEGLYYVKRIDPNNIKIAKSLSNLYNENYIELEEEITVNNNIIQLYKFKNKFLSPQNLLREISQPENTGKIYKTSPGFTGILINGTEILNYKSSDKIYYGSIKNIDILSKGSDYDVINPPILSISDNTGIGATGYCSVKGSFKEIRIIDSGFDFIETPSIKISGGNGFGAKAQVNLKTVPHEVIFNSSGISTSVDISNNTIGFSTYHKFRNGEKVIYKTFSQYGVSGLSTDAIYYVSILDSHKIKLHRDYNGSIVGINTVEISDYGVGNHSIKSFNGKYILGSISIVDPGIGYENKKRTCSSSGINTALDSINIEDHDYKTGEIITYMTDGSTPLGLSNNTEYYVTALDKDNFKLSEVGIGSIAKDFYFQTNQHIDIETVGVGTHIFNYPNILVEITSKIGISSSVDNNFKGSLQPIVRGEITSIYLENKGVGYGSSEILNYKKDLNLNLYSGSKAQLTPIVNDGKITDVVINFYGQDYNSPPELKVYGKGSGAKLTPVIENGQIKSVVIVEGGIGYENQNTKIEVIPAGKGAFLKANLNEWTVNLFKKYFNNFGPDDGVLENSIKKDYGLEYSHLYAPRELRKILYSSDRSGITLFGKKDLQLSNGIEINSTNHSPIIGWSYDGNPIYGPYGYIKKSGGTVSQMKSGYVLDLKPDRPPTSIFPQEFFIEDFTYVNSEDETVLDENNGRFCVTPEFPNGVYAYFTSVSQNVDSDGVFKNYKRPVFPYLIGENYTSKPNDFNFNPSSNQENINLNETGWLRNVYPYNLSSKNSYYSYVIEPNDLKQQKSLVKFATKGSIDFIGIVSSGNNYQVNDKVVFDNTKTDGFGATAKVSRVLGKQINNISVATSSISNVEFYPSDQFGVFVGFSSLPHYFKNKDLVKIVGLNTTSSFLENSYEIGISTSQYILTSPVSSTSVTGLVTYFSISGDFDFQSIRENDIFSVGVGTEKIKVLNVDPISSRIRVLREFGSSSGVSHTTSTVLREISRKFNINVGYKTTYDYKLNKEIYFNPSETVGIGTTAGIGIGVTLIIENPGVGVTQVFVPSKTIYLPNHKLETGDQLIYNVNSGTALGVSTSGLGNTYFELKNKSIVYVAKISNDSIGISTIKVGLGSTGTFCGIAETTRNQGTLYFINKGSGTYHSFETNYPLVVNGKISKNLVTVSVAETHGLQLNDYAYVEVTPTISTTITLKYNDSTRRVIINPKDFISSGINTSNGNINLPSHGFITGQRVLHTSSSPCGGLKDNHLYNVLVLDSDNIKLTESLYQTKQSYPITVGITSSSFGTLSAINPPIKVYRNCSINFDTSDPSLSYVLNGTSYPAFDLEFYLDDKFTRRYESNQKLSSFEVSKVGTLGVTPNAKTILNINQYTPNLLYYKLTPLKTFSNPKEKTQIVIDDSISLYNQIQIEQSEYSGKKRISSLTSTSFEYNLLSSPEKNSYSETEASLSYTTDSISAYGPINQINIQNGGKSYSTLPGISSVISKYGDGFILEPNSKTIGNVKSTKIFDIGFDYPADFTLKPTSKLPEILKIEPLSTFESIGVTSFGYGYSISPKLVVIDGKTKKQITDIDLKFTLGEEQVKIIKNTLSINNTEPIILPIQNSNGVPISNITYNSSNKDVTVTLSVGFSTADSFPFAVNDKVMIENVSVGVGSTGKGYNSSNYDYNLFTIKSVLPNIGGIGIVTFSLTNYLGSNENPGNFDAINSSGRIIPEKHFPKFNSILKKGEFLKGENVTDGNAIGIVGDWNPKTEYLKVITSEDFVPQTIIEGQSSNSKGFIKDIIKSESNYELGSYSLVENGWEFLTGFLNNDLQRIHDNEYYQSFSYSLKSKIPYDTWKDSVSSLNHTLGFKKFSNLQLESTITENSSMIPEFSEYASVKTDIISVTDLNCVTNFDLVYENSLYSNSGNFSDEIIFSSRILQDYQESVGNRVLLIDDISGEFNSEPGFNIFVDVSRSLLSSFRTQKFFTYVKDRRYTSERQAMLVTILRDDLGFSYINQYGRVETIRDLGSFDFYIDGTEGVLRFYPTKYTYNNYDVSTISYNLDDNLTSIGNTDLGGVVSIASSSSSFVGVSTIVSISNSYSSSKVLICLNHEVDGQFEYNELNIIHNGTDVYVLDGGQLTNHSYSDPYSSIGLGTFYPYLSGSDLKVDFIPSAGISTVVVNTIAISIGNTSMSGIGTIDLNQARIEASSTSIAATSLPTQTSIASYPDGYDAAYCIVQATNTSTGECQLSEVILIDDGTETYLTEYAILETYSGIGTISASRVSETTYLSFTPIENIDVDVKVFINALAHIKDEEDIINFNNSTIETSYATYYGTLSTIKKDFDLTYKTYPIFKRNFFGNQPDIVNLTNNTISIPNHFFVTGEELVYNNTKNSLSISTYNSTNAIGIGTTTILGIGSTDRLPSSVYAVKVDINKIKLATSAENALKSVPVTIDLESVGIGSTHVFISKNQNQRVIIFIDNIVQSPIVSTSTTSSTAQPVLATDEIIYFTGITSFFGGDILKIDDEIMRIEGIGIGSTNAIRVRREILGTISVGHSSDAKIVKVVGDYNIVENTLSFVDAPYGNTPIGTSSLSPNNRDWAGITTSSTFQGRVFIRSGIEDSSEETYSKNYIFDDISSSFNGYNKNFTLKSNNSNVTGISTDNAIILINNIFQGPNQGQSVINDYDLSEEIGITSISFTGTASSVAYDPNNANIPVGGVIVSVGSVEGFGYQPLIGAGGTAIVSAAGTISSISIGNSGSGYRSGIQTVHVGVALSSTGTPYIDYIGTAFINNGHVVSVAITNPGVGYTNTNPPYVLIDKPLSYSNIPLVYSSSSGGNGAQAKVNIVVGQGSSIIDFNIINTGYGYGVSEILTVETGGSTGIPTTSDPNFSEFQLTIQQLDADKFTGWSIGQLQVLDDFSNLFNGTRVSFPIQYGGNSLSIQASPGSNIKIQDTLLVFINDIIQVPNKSYIFNGGSSITFTEAPKFGDTLKLIFYRGTGGVDVVEKDILETVKIGDSLKIGYNSYDNQPSYYQENERIVNDITSSNVVDTNPYYGPGNINDPNLKRPIDWCRQIEDKFINSKVVTKDRVLYEPIINPSSYLIQSVGIGSTIAFVDNIRPFFNPINENQISLDFQRGITFISQNNIVSASGTATVSAAGTISSIEITNGGVGYSTSPEVTIECPIGLGSTTKASATSVISIGGTVSSVIITSPGTGYTNTNPPLILISPPTLKIENNTSKTNGYEGDFGIITGISTTSIGIASTGIVFDLLIPSDSFLRNSSIVTTPITESGIKTGYYFMVYDSNVGNGVTSIDSNGNIVGVGTSFLDNIYYVSKVSIAQTATPGFGITSVAKVTVSVSSYNGLSGVGYSNYYGKYSWGKISLGNRLELLDHEAYTTNGVSGIKTGTIVKRKYPLKYLNYS
jgi:hypothetical protein